MSTLQLREATIDDLALLRRWDDAPQVVDADPSDDWAWETELLRRPDWRTQLIAEVDGRPIGFMEIADPVRADDAYWADWLAAHPDHPHRSRARSTSGSARPMPWVRATVPACSKRR